MTTALFAIDVDHTKTFSSLVSQVAQLMRREATHPTPVEQVTIATGAQQPLANVFFNYVEASTLSFRSNGCRIPGEVVGDRPGLFPLMFEVFQEEQRTQLVLTTRDDIEQREVLQNALAIFVQVLAASLDESSAQKEVLQ